jgi:diguanylate cyclase (GGDEF)-like protein
MVSLRLRILILVLLVTAPIVGERIRGLEIARSDRFKITGTSLLDLARHESEMQAQILDAARIVMTAAIVAQPRFGKDASVCASVMKELIRADESINALSLASPAGIIFCSTAPALVGVDLAERRYFQTAIASMKLAVSDVIVSARLRKPVLLAALPKRQADGGAEFVVIASLNFASIESLAAELKERPGATALIVTEAGALVTRFPAIERPTGEDIHDYPLVKQILSDQSASFNGIGLDGVRRIFGSVRLGDTNAYLAVGIDEEQVLKTVNRQMRLAYVAVVAALFIALVGAWFGGDYFIVRPLRKLVEMAARYGRGDYEATDSSSNVPPEFAPLERALSRMAAELANRENDLRAKNQRLDHLAQVDSLTSLPNRRQFDARLEREWAASASSGEPLSLLMIDVDYFKRFNDCFGHIEGDACLKKVAACLARDALRPGDFIARYGGEEFAVVLPSENAESSLKIAERLREAVVELNIPNNQGGLGRVTISVGVASLSADADGDPRMLLEQADAALYTAKNRGRNTVSARFSTLLDLLAG